MLIWIWLRKRQSVSAHHQRGRMSAVVALYKFCRPPIYFVAKLRNKSVVALNEFQNTAPSNNQETRGMVTTTNLLMHSQTSLRL